MPLPGPIAELEEMILGTPLTGTLSESRLLWFQ